MKNLSIFKREYTDGIKRRETREGSYVATLVLVHFFFTVHLCSWYLVRLAYTL